MGKKVVKQKEYAQNEKQPKSIEDPEGYLKMHPIWAFHKIDTTHEKWSVKNCKEFYDDIIKKLVAFEGLTWAEIMSASGGRRCGTNNHFEYISDLCKEAQKRANELHLNVDQVFSLRLEGKLRIYGILEEGIFRLLWYDPFHEICPSQKRNT